MVVEIVLIYVGFCSLELNQLNELIMNLSLKESLCLVLLSGTVFILLTIISIFPIFWGKFIIEYLKY